MKKIIYSLILIILLLPVLIIIYLSAVGIETSRFNNIIIKEIKKKDLNTQLSLNKIKIKFDLQKFQIYLSTLEPNIVYQNIKIPKDYNLESIMMYMKDKFPIMSSSENISHDGINRTIVHFYN